MKRLISKARERRGDLTSSLVSLLIITAAFALVLSALPVFSKIHYLHSYLDDITRYIELTGSMEGIEDTVETLNGRYYPDGDVPELDLESGMSFIPGTVHIQLGESFMISAVYVYDFRVSGLFSIPIRLRARSSGRSEVYYK